MTTSFKIDIEKSIIYTSVKGEISAEELIEHIERVNNDPQFNKGMNTLADFSQAMASHTIDIEKVKKTIKYTETIEDVRGNCKWAIFTKENHMYGFLQMFSTLSKGMKIEVGIFKSKNEAESWIAT